MEDKVKASVERGGAGRRTEGISRSAWHCIQNDTVLRCQEGLSVIDVLSDVQEGKGMLQD